MSIAVTVTFVPANTNLLPGVGVFTDVSILKDKETFDNSVMECVENSAQKNFNLESIEVIGKDIVDNNIVRVEGYITELDENGDGENDMNTYKFIAEKHLV